MGTIFGDDRDNLLLGTVRSDTVEGRGDASRDRSLGKAEGWGIPGGPAASSAGAGGTVLLRRAARMFLVVALALAVGAAAPAEAHGVTERVSVGPGGAQSNGHSWTPALSADGRFIAFSSLASNLVPGDTNGVYDVFVRDRRTGTTRRVSVGRSGVQSDGSSLGDVALSADGRFVAFTSDATNLVPGDTNGFPDSFVHDLRTGTIQRVSVGPNDVQANSGSAVAAISADGRFVALSSHATNLVPGDTNGWVDVFVRDRRTGTTRRVSVGACGVQGNNGSAEPALSADGRFVAFQSDATNLVPGDTNSWSDIFVRDRRARTTRRVSVGPRGVQGDGFSGLSALSADGRFVAFGSFATNLVPGDTNEVEDIFVHDLQTGTTRRVSVGAGNVQSTGHSFDPALSPDGRHVAFISHATNLVPGDTNGWSDIFVNTR